MESFSHISSGNSILEVLIQLGQWPVILEPSQ